MKTQLEYHRPARALINVETNKPVILFSENLKPDSIDRKIDVLAYLAVNNSNSVIGFDTISSAIQNVAPSETSPQKTDVYDIYFYLEDAELLQKRNGKDFLLDMTISNSLERTLDEDTQIRRRQHEFTLKIGGENNSITNSTRYMMGLITPNLVEREPSEVNEQKPNPKSKKRVIKSTYTFGGQDYLSGDQEPLDNTTKERVLNILTSPEVSIRKHQDAILVLDIILNPSISAQVLGNEVLTLQKSDVDSLIQRCRNILGGDRFSLAWNARIIRGDLRTGTTDSNVILTSGGGRQRGETLRETSDIQEHRFSEDALSSFV